MSARIVIMGVSGCGKSSVGEALAELGLVEFIDGDALHPESNIEKMRHGTPLNDADRAPWLDEVGRVLGAAETPTAIGCSALKRAYRDRIRNQVNGQVHFLHLYASKDVLAKRVAARKGHFMPPELLDSQFATLEQLQPDELGKVVDISVDLDQVAKQAADIVREWIS